MSASLWGRRICLGTAQLGLDYGIANSTGRPDDASCEALLSRALERGILQFDTARAYGDAERRLGRFFAKHPMRDHVRVVSKLPTLPKDLPAGEVLEFVTTEIDNSLQSLGIERLAAWLIHEPAAERDYGSAIWDAMQAQVDRGAVDRVGISVYDEQELRSALIHSEASVVQLPLNLLDHRVTRSGMLDEAAGQNTMIYARSALLQGVLTMEASRIPEQLLHLKAPLLRLHEILEKYELIALDVALPFVLSHAKVDFAVIGVDNVTQLDENLARAERRLPAGLCNELHLAFADLPAQVLEPRRWYT